jgi:hypothetical protein
MAGASASSGAGGGAQGGGGVGSPSAGQDGSGGSAPSGSSGSGGTGGAGGQAGLGGSTLLSGASGEGGDAGSGGEPGCAPHRSGDIQAWLHQDIINAQDNEIHPAFLLTRTGLSVPLKQLAIRYYFSGEAFGAWELTCLWVTKAGDADHGLCDEGVSMQVVALDPPLQQVDQYLEISFAGVASATLSEGFPIEARVMFWRAGHPMLNLANDYSFEPTLQPELDVDTRTYRQTSRVTVYRDGALVWGEEPCP